MYHHMHLFYLFLLLPPPLLCCSQGQYYMPGSGGNCNDCDPSCSDCYWDTVVLCTGCQMQHFFDGNLNACNPCPKDCLQCSVSATLCDYCKAGYTLETDGGGNQTCNLYWWVIFLWTFGLLVGAVVLVGVFLCLRKTCDTQEEKEEKKEYQMTKEDIRS